MPSDYCICRALKHYTREKFDSYDHLKLRFPPFLLLALFFLEQGQTMPEKWTTIVGTNDYYFVDA